ncbi:MAG: lytic transglycosylase domain-containing protein [Halanaerobiales bacterium]
MMGSKDKIIKRAFFILGLLIFSMLLISQMNWFWRLLFPIEYEDLIIASAQKYQLDPSLVAAIVFVESKYIPTASSYRGAMGLMQIMPDTGVWIAEQLAIRDFEKNMLFDPVINIMFGCWYLANLKQEFNDDLVVVLAAYNAGRGNVKKWLENNIWDGCQESIENLPFAETKRYIQQVLAVYEKYKTIYNL